MTNQSRPIRGLPSTGRCSDRWRCCKSIAQPKHATLSPRSAMCLPQLEPLMLWRRVLLALAETISETARAHAVEMEQAVATTDGLIPEHRIMAHFDLAQFWCATGRS